jgi:hypothetical protein
MQRIVRFALSFWPLIYTKYSSLVYWHLQIFSWRPIFYLKTCITPLEISSIQCFISFFISWCSLALIWYCWYTAVVLYLPYFTYFTLTSLEIDIMYLIVTVIHEKGISKKAFWSDRLSSKLSLCIAHTPQNIKNFWVLWISTIF